MDGHGWPSGHGHVRSFEPATSTSKFRWRTRSPSSAMAIARFMVFHAAASSSVQTTCSNTRVANPRDEDFVPAKPLAAFDGESLSGDWTLNVADHAPGEAGILHEWCMNFTSDLVFVDGLDWSGSQSQVRGDDIESSTGKAQLYACSSVATDHRTKRAIFSAIEFHRASPLVQKWPSGPHFPVRSRYRSRCLGAMRTRQTSLQASCRGSSWPQRIVHTSLGVGTGKIKPVKRQCVISRKILRGPPDRTADR